MSGVWIALVLLIVSSVARSTAQTAPDSFDDVAREAAAARERNDVSAAIGLYGRAVSLKPEWPDGWWFLGMLQYGTGDYADAREALNHYIALMPQAGPAVAVRGLCEFETADYRQSLQDIQKGLALGAANQSENEAALRYHLALLLTLNGDFEDALREYGFFVRNKIAAPEIFMAIGLAGLRIPVLPKDLKTDLQAAPLAAGTAGFHAMAGDTEVAGREFQDVFQRFPAAANAHYLWGYLLFAKDPERAAGEFRRELEIDAGNEPAEVMLAWSLLLRNSYSEALPYAEKAAVAAPDSSTAQLVLGRALVETGAVSDGLRHLETALKLDPDNIEIHIALAGAYSRLGRKDDARRERLLCLERTKNEAPFARP
jgi:tetratricopeptide (TPR) repeat protein